MASRGRPSSSMAQSRNPRQRPLPSGFVSIRDILDESVPANRFTSVIGLVKDYRLPMMTGGTDWKSTVTLYDKSTEHDHDGGLLINIFRPEEEMPRPGPGDVVIVYQAKVQQRGGISLLTNRQQTVIHVYSAVMIPRPPTSAGSALNPPRGKQHWRPGDREHEYVSWLYHSVNKDAVPDQGEFRMQTERSLNIKDKFSLLKDVREGRFYDVIAQVVKDPFDEMDKMNIWVSDYTENDAFFLYSLDRSKGVGAPFGDPYAYTTKHQAAPNTSAWPGPFGKRSVQVACWEPHASHVRENISAGDWVRLRNLHIKYGRSSMNLEGALHEDRNAFSGRVQAELLDTGESENFDDRLKDAIRRKRDYEKTKKQQQKKYAASETASENASGAGTKRKADDPGRKPNRKQRRTAKRAVKRKELEEQDKRAEQLLGLNHLIKCESQDQPVMPLSTILEPTPWTTTVDGEEVTLNLPFVCAKYRANARVVDFRPRRLENFARWRKVTEYEQLSDYSGSEGSDSGDDDRGTLEGYYGKKTWEWRFALQLEEVNPKAKGDKPRLWVVVDNIEAQQLVSLDACDLRDHPDELSALREQLFKLWGNLEEVKALEQEQNHQNQKRLAAGQPPDSSPPAAPDGNANEEKLSNKPFTCCIRQYGVKLPERDPHKANAGDGKRWERLYGLFGTKISGK